MQRPGGATATLPTPESWRRLWRLWDAATGSLIPAGRHCDQPLQLRQPFVFYLGHLPAFADARLARVLRQPLTPPAEWADAFARGIDPDLDNPSQCHAHSPTPAVWPAVGDINAYRDRVRARILQLCHRKASTSPAPAALQHLLWMCYEHEAMHLETLLYLLVQYEAVLPPPAELVPSTPAAAWCSHLLAQQQAGGSSNGSSDGPAMRSGPLLLPLPPVAEWVPVPAGPVTLGFTPQQHSSSSTAQFGWDNESPARVASVPEGVQMQHRPVSVLEYLQFVASKLADSLVASPGAQPASDATAAAAPSLCSAAQHTCAVSSSSGQQQDASSSSSSSSLSALPEVFAGLRGSSATASCAACRECLVPLLEARLGASLMPASLTVLPAQPPAAGGRERNCQQGPCCSGLCRLLLPGGAGVGASGSNTPDSSSSNSCQGQASALQAALLGALQLTVAAKSVFGPVPVCVAGLWPVYCSALHAEQYAAWFSAATGNSCRLPTEPEVLAAAQASAAVQSSSGSSGGSGPEPEGVRSVDFAVWHPVCVPLAAARHSSSSGSGSGSGAVVSQLRDNGWEWTCTPFGSHAGFTPHPLYPEYSQDFFGGKHVVLLGASWATLDSIAGRPSFRNFYQKGQQHVFGKCRLVREAKQD